MFTAQFNSKQYREATTKEEKCKVHLDGWKNRTEKMRNEYDEYCPKSKSNIIFCPQKIIHQPINKVQWVNDHFKTLRKKTKKKKTKRKKTKRKGKARRNKKRRQRSGGPKIQINWHVCNISYHVVLSLRYFSFLTWTNKGPVQGRMVYVFSLRLWKYYYTVPSWDYIYIKKASLIIFRCQLI